MSSQQERMSGNLSQKKISMLKFVRDHYKACDFFPTVNSICKNVHAPKNCVAEKFFNPLVTLKIAGLPQKPIKSSAVTLVSSSRWSVKTYRCSAFLRLG